MRREVFEKSGSGIPFEENLIFYAPLTENGDDIIGGKQSNSSGYNISYSSDGITFGGNSYIWYEFTQQEALSAKTLHCTIKPLSQRNTYDYMYVFGTKTTPLYYRIAICRQQSSGKACVTVGRSSNRYDYDVATSEQFPLNVEKKFTFVLEPSTQKLYCDGTLIWNSGAADSWTAWGLSVITLVLGGTSTNQRDCNAIIKDFRIYDRALTASEVAQL